jgi:hypothetical protein
LTSNVGWHPTVGAAGIAGGNLLLLLGPEWTLTKNVSIVAEVDVVAPVGAWSGTSATFVPTVSATFDPAGARSAALGALVPLSAAAGPLSVGAWYSWIFDVGGPAAADPK